MLTVCLWPVEIDGKLGVRIFNADGSESAISGNGVRIFAKYLMDNGYITEKKFDIEAMSGTIHVECLNSRATEFKVNMGNHLLSPAISLFPVKFVK